MITHYQFVGWSHRLRLIETLLTLATITYTTVTALATVIQYGSYYIPKKVHILQLSCSLINVQLEWHSWYSDQATG